MSFGLNEELRLRTNAVFNRDFMEDGPGG